MNDTERLETAKLPSDVRLFSQKRKCRGTVSLAKKKWDANVQGNPDFKKRVEAFDLIKRAYRQADQSLDWFNRDDQIAILLLGEANEMLDKAFSILLPLIDPPEVVEDEIAC